ncbi:hypothetical protein Q0601_19485 [Paracoccus onubensis]|nr:hypothetical protein [Paracoccus onubensis]MDP0929374.1 hypothetical protein [Paracoccus onubensis]
MTKPIGVARRDRLQARNAVTKSLRLRWNCDSSDNATIQEATER